MFDKQRLSQFRMCLAILRGVGVRGVVCGVRGVSCWGVEHGFRGAGCEMLSLILELQTYQLSFRPLVCSHCHDSLTQKYLSHVLLRYTSRTNPHSTPHIPRTAPRSL